MSCRILFASWGWPQYSESDKKIKKQYDEAIKAGTVILTQKTRSNKFLLVEYIPPGKTYSRYILIEKTRSHYTISEYDSQWEVLDAYEEARKCPTITQGTKQIT